MSSRTKRGFDSARLGDAAPDVLEPHAPVPQQAKNPDTLSDVLKILPKDAMEQRPGFAFFTAARVWLTVFVAFYLVTISPWYLLPFAWVFLGTAATGLFVVGHDCAHQSFSRSRTLNEIVGTIAFGPLIFPYNCWELTHNNHHAHANNMDRDHLWRPMRKEHVEKMGAFGKYLNYFMYGPLFFESSIIHHALHFQVPFRTKKNPLGAARSCVFAILGFVLTAYVISFFGPLWKLYVVPFLVFQFWLSTFTYFHHRNPRGAGWKEPEDWNRVYGSLFATVHVGFPAWVEWLTLDINWHLPHHVSPLIPWYNLRRCTHALLQAYGDRMLTDEFSWQLWKETTTSCHLYSKEGYANMWD